MIKKLNQANISYPNEVNKNSHFEKNNNDILYENKQLKEENEKLNIKKLIIICYMIYNYKSI